MSPYDVPGNFLVFHALGRKQNRWQSAGNFLNVLSCKCSWFLVEFYFSVFRIKKAALAQAMAWYRTGDYPWPEPVLTNYGLLAKYRKVSNIRRTLVGNKIVDHSDVVGASPVGAAPTTSSFST